MEVTQQELAEELGLSLRSVARALHGHGKVSEETRRKVLETAKQRGYQPYTNAGARALAAKRYGRRSQAGLIGCVSLNSGDRPLPYYVHLQDSIRRSANAAGREVLLLSPDPSPGWEKVDGLIGLAEKGAAARRKLPVEVPYVSLMEPLANTASAGADDYDGARQATQHLLSLGHRNIGYLVYPGWVTEARIAGYTDALRGAGVEPHSEWQRVLWNWGPMEKRGRRSMEDWLEDGFEALGLTGLLVQNDRAAIGAMQALQEVGYRLPQQMSVVGFDSTDECELVWPRLTSVRVPLGEIGEKAVELLLRQIEDEEAELATVTFPVQLEVRDSTAPPAKQ